MLDDTALDVVDDFQYLGAWINDTMKDFQNQSAKAWTAFWKLKKIWVSNAGIKLKMKFFDTSVLSVLLYATKLCYRQSSSKQNQCFPDTMSKNHLEYQQRKPSNKQTCLHINQY